MKLLFYINAIHHGGAERVMVNLTKDFAEAGYETVLVTSFTDTWEYPVDSRVKRISLSEEIPKGFLKRNYFLVKRLRAVIKEEKPDSVVSFMAEPNFRMLLATVGIKCRKIVSIRNDPDREYPNRLFRFLAKTLYRRADGVVFQTEDAKHWFPKSIQKKSEIIMNQVDSVFFSTALADERHDIVTTGRLTSQKNHKLLIQAYSLIANEIDEDLVIYGDGELREELETLIAELGLQDRVFLPGATKNVPEVLSRAKLFVLSSDYEGMPNSLMEAMAMGLPCISTDCPCGGPRMIIENNVNGYMFTVGDADALSINIKRVVEMASENLQKISNNAKLVMQSCEPKSVFEKWENYIS